MRFLVDANMPRSCVQVVQRFGHTVDDVRDIGLGDALDTQIATRAQATKASLLTRDVDFADIRNYPPSQYYGIVVLRLPEDSIVSDILMALERFLTNRELVEKISGHLVILESNRVRFRPALPSK